MDLSYEHTMDNSNNVVNINAALSRELENIGESLDRVYQP